MGAQIGEALEESRLVASAIGEVTMRFETAPRILDDTAMSDILTLGTLTLGSSAIAFDPICGDDVATAVRGGILAPAVAAEMIADTGLDRAALIGHYRAVLIAAMRRHLAVSSPFYERGGKGPWWASKPKPWRTAMPGGSTHGAARRDDPDHHAQACAGRSGRYGHHAWQWPRADRDQALGRCALP